MTPPALAAVAVALGLVRHDSPKERSIRDAPSLREAIDAAARFLTRRGFERLIANAVDGHASSAAALALAEVSVCDAEERLRALAEPAESVTRWREGIDNGRKKRT